MSTSRKIIIIAGPTASGKSSLAMEIARRVHGTIINADAMQIYAGLPVLTAQPTAAEQKEIPHEIYAVLDAGEKSSVGRWRALALSAIEKTLKANRTPILTGGTGLYFRALFDGLAEIPDIPDEVRATVQGLYDALGEEKFRIELAKRDAPSATRIERNDRQRLMRAYEVVLHTGKALSQWHEQSPDTATLLKDFTIEKHVLMPGREALYAACDKRFASMIEQGAVEEVRNILQRNLDPELPAMKTLGLREIAAHTRGEISLNDSVSKAQQATRNYAKRQMTWFRNQKLPG